MADYRDYGTINGVGRTDTAVNTTRYTQVYKATHTGEGNRLPLMNRSFISFTYGGKSIEDFNLIATIEDNKLGRDGYAQFTDITATYSGLNGQQFYGMNFNTNTLSLTLATDSMEQKMLDDFLNWFIAGESRELILAEHPNRGILARVKTPPVLDLLPYDRNVKLLISGYEYETKTTDYRGTIKLEFVMDYPHWYSLMNVLGVKVYNESTEKDRYVDDWMDYTDKDFPEGKRVPILGDGTYVFSSKDALKVLYEDGIPLGSMFDNNMLLGNGAYASVEDEPSQKTWSPEESESQITWTMGLDNELIPSGEGARVDGTLTFSQYVDIFHSLFTDHQGLKLYVNNDPSDPNGEAYYRTQVCEDGITRDESRNLTLHFNVDANTMTSIYNLNVKNEYKYVGVIAGAIVDATGDGIARLDENKYGHFYYSGTAPTPTILSFTLVPELGVDGFIKMPFNASYNKYSGDTTSAIYNTITIESIHKQNFCFTTPNIFTSYNKAMQILKEMSDTKDWEKVRSRLRDEVRHAKVRAWAIGILDFFSNNENAIVDDCREYMTYFLKDPSSSTCYPAHFSFNSYNGQATGEFTYRIFESMTNNNGTIQIVGRALSEPVKEDVGDMLRSNYIIIADRNRPTAEGRIVGWRENHPEYSHRIYHDISGGITKLQILYKNMYL